LGRSCHIARHLNMIAIMLADLKLQLHDFQGQELTFAPGQYLFHLGDVVTVFHFIEEGLVHLIRHQTDGSALVLQRAGAGSILAEASLYSDEYHCDAVVQTQTRLLALPKKQITARLATSPVFAEAWARHLAQEVQRARLQAEILSLHTVAARLDAWIAWNDGRIPGKGEWKAIADQIGVSPEALYRELARRRSNRR
jgi:CRP/FNR family transcriptional regulator, dissimilatory nitrate respiration regulator